MSKTLSRTQQKKLRRELHHARQKEREGGYTVEIQMAINLESFLVSGKSKSILGVSLKRPSKFFQLFLLGNVKKMILDFLNPEFGTFCTLYRTGAILFDDLDTKVSRKIVVKYTHPKLNNVFTKVYDARVIVDNNTPFIEIRFPQKIILISQI